MYQADGWHILGGHPDLVHANMPVTLQRANGDMMANAFEATALFTPPDESSAAGL
jgi:hypothetical protein